MEITSFILGMLTIVAVIILTVIVVGLVKINFLTRKIELLQQLCAAIESDLRRELENTNREIWQQFDNTSRDTTMVEKTLMNQIDATRRETDQAVDELHRAVGHESSEGRRYTDSRIDKLIDTYFDMKKVNEKKEILKG